MNRPRSFGASWKIYLLRQFYRNFESGSLVLKNLINHAGVRLLGLANKSYSLPTTASIEYCTTESNLGPLPQAQVLKFFELQTAWRHEETSAENIRSLTVNKVLSHSS